MTVSAEVVGETIMLVLWPSREGVEENGGIVGWPHGCICGCVCVCVALFSNGNKIQQSNTVPYRDGRSNTP